MKTADAIAHVLKAEGVDILFAYPVNPIIEACAVADIRTLICRQERIGLHMADAYSRMSSGKKIGVFSMQHGPGSENAFGGVAQAYSESSPILVLPAGYPRRIANYYPNFNSARSMESVTKWAEPLTMGRAIPEVMRRAFFQLRNGRPGPVLVEIPMDVFGEEAPENWVYEPSYATRSAPDPDAVDEAAAVLAGAERPVIYAGQGVHYAEAWDELKALAEAWNIPVTTSLEGKSAFPETHPLSLGSGGRANPRPVKTFLAEADVILGVGCSFALTGFGVPMPRGKTIIHATLDPMDLNKDVAAQHALIGDAKLCLAHLSQALDGRDRSHADSRKHAVRGASPPSRRSGSPNGRPSATTTRRPSIRTAYSTNCTRPWTSTTPSSLTTPAVRATRSPRSGRARRRSRTSAGARPPSSATASDSRWARSSPSPTSSA